MSARDRILGRLRAGQPRAPLPLPDVDPARVAAVVPASAATPLERMTTCLTNMHAEVVPVTETTWAARLAEICAAKQVRSLAVGTDARLPDNWSGPELHRFDREIGTWKTTLFNEIDAGLVHADCAIADTGVLAVRSSPAQPRTLSLVPPVSFCVVDARRLYPTLLDALQGERWEAAMPTNLIFISGPSKTADIQQTLAYGAHGPKELVVLVILPEAQQ